MNEISQVIRIDTLPPELKNLRNISIPKLIPPLVNLIIITSVVLFLFSFLIGGIKMIISGGDKERMGDASRQVINAIIGISIVFSTWAIISLIEQFFGVKLTTLQLPRINY